MPIYCFTTRAGKTVERFFPMGQAPEQIRVGGRVAYRDFLAEHAKTRPAGNWPMLSDALGVNPDQISEAEAHSRSIGIPTHFTADGRAILESPGHRKRYAEALGFFDRNGGYSDPQRR